MGTKSNPGGDYGRCPDYARDERGNSIRIDSIDRLDITLHSLAVDALCGLPPASRFEVRMDYGRPDGTFGLAWYRCQQMDEDPAWGTAMPGPKNGYVLIGQYTTPAGKPQTVQ